MSKTILLHRTEAADATKVLKFMHKVHERNYPDVPLIVDRFALPWVTDVICYGVALSASLNGRLVGTIGLRKQSHPWNLYKQHLGTEWLHVLDDYKDSEVRTNLILKARKTAEEMGYDLDIKVPGYLHETGDVDATCVERTYFYGV